MIIKLCSQNEIPQLIEFLKEFWNPNHVLVNHTELLMWQYENENDGLNFLIAKDENSDSILAILGFIPLSHYDASLAHHKEIWGAVWRVSPNCRIPGLGTYLQKKICAEYDFYAGLGISSDSVHIQKSLAVKILNSNQYFLLNSNIADYQIAEVSDRFIPNTIERNCNFELQEIFDVSKYRLNHSYHPVKSILFLKNRYEKHPWYEYHFLGCFIEGEICCILVYRKITVENRSVIRIVDAYGNLNPLMGLGYKLQEFFMDKSDEIEYVDFCNYGIDPDFFFRNGFNLLDTDSKDIIIPHYFEPFVKKNIALQGVIIAKEDKNYTFFKADADQDRPNIL